MTLAEFKRTLVERANYNRGRIKNFSDVLNFCDAELVFAVWPDAVEADGIGWLIIRGGQIVEFIKQSNISEELIVEVIPCIELEQAEALRLHLLKRLPV